MERLQILSSSFLVTSSMDIYLGADPESPDDPDLKSAQFMLIGKIQLNDPSKAPMQGRQFQVIELQGNAKLKVNYVKLSLKHNHMFKKNEFNQVGLLGISVLGLPKPSGLSRSPSLSRRGSRTEENSLVPRRQDLNFLMYTDKDIAEVSSLLFKAI